MPFITDGSPLETTPDQAGQTYQDQISPSFRSNVGTGFVQDSLIGAVSGAAERGEFKQSSWFDRALVGMSQANSGLDVTTPKDDPDAYKTVLAKQKQDQDNRQESLARFSNQHSWPVNMASGMASFMLDPLQASSAIIPGVGEDAVLSKLGGGFLARTAARVTAGATAGGLSQLPVSLAKAGISSIDDQDYTLRDAATDVFMGAAAGALFHTGIGTLSDVFSKAITKAPPQVQHDAMATATAQIAEGKPVDVQNVIKPDYSPGSLEDKNTLIDNRNLVLRSLEVVGDDTESSGAKAQLQQSLKDIDNKLYVSDLRDQEKEILGRVNGNEEDLTEDHADQLSLIRQELYRTVDSPSDLAHQQQELDAQGYQPSVSQAEIQQTKAEVAENAKNPQPDKTLNDHVREAQDLETTWEDMNTNRILYHGTQADIKEFRKTTGGQFGPGVYLTTNPEEAGRYATATSSTGGETPNILPVKASIKNPFRVTADIQSGNPVKWFQKHGFNTQEDPLNIKAQRALKAKGYDGVIAKQPSIEGLDESGKIKLGPEQTHYIAFEPEQIKSAIGSKQTISDLSIEDHQELQASKAAVDQSNLDEQGYNQASNCLGEAGV